MMCIISKTIYLSSVFSLVYPVASFASFNPAYASLVDTSQNQTFESRPANSIKLAAVHFIANDGALNFGNQEFLPGDLCKQGGYSHEGCPSGYIKGEACPYDSKFVKDCIDPDTWCKNNGYNVTSCSVPKYLTTVCPYKSTLYKSCETDNIRACKELGYSLSCDTGKVGDSAQTCPYNSSYKKCICNPCSGYNYTAEQASAQGYVPGEVCNSCGTMKYKRSENKCDGYKTCDCGGETGAKVCYSGSVQKFDTCKTCCDAKYQYDSSNCTGGKVLAGNSCGGKYESCTSPCGSEYIYDEANCPSSKFLHCKSDSCNGKYKDCITPFFLTSPFTFKGMTYVEESKTEQCPNTKKVTPNARIANGMGLSLYPCLTASQACIDIQQKLPVEKDVYINSDLYCGNIRLEAKGNTVTLHGNGHTLTFDNIDDVDIGGYNDKADRFIVENLTIVSHGSQASYSKDSCGQTVIQSEVAANVTFKNVKIKTVKRINSIHNVKFYGTNYVEALITDISHPYSPIWGIGRSLEVYGTLNVKNMGLATDYITVAAGGILNFKNLTNYRVSDSVWGGLKEMTLRLGDNSKGTFNICVDSFSISQCLNKNTAAVNYSGNLTSNNCPSTSVSAQKQSGLCSSSIFQGSFWQ